MELTGISAYGLTSFRSSRAEALAAGFRYLVLGAVATSLLLFGVALLYGAFGTVNYADLAQRIGEGMLLGGNGKILVPASLILIVSGLGIKTAFFPLHAVHLDATSESPSPVGAILSGAETKVGIYALCRVLFLVFPVGNINFGFIVAVISLFTMTFGNVAALLQDDIKRMLAYSSVAHIGYILIGVAAGTTLGLSGALFHVFNHSVMKGISFLCAGIFLHQVGTRKLSELSGVGRKLPVTTVILSITFLSLIGVPPLSGFVSKFILFTAGVAAGMVWLVIAGIVNSALSAGYYLRFLKTLTRLSPNPRIEKAREASPILLAAPLILLTLIVVFGVWPHPILEFSNQAALSLFQVKEYVSTVLGG
jgi:multicomponent Na+:H+ antiporter subunit D